MKFCAYHKIEEPLEGFRIHKNGKYDSWCIEGRREYNRQYSKTAYAPKKQAVAEKREVRETRTEQTCTGCKEVKPIEQFPIRNDRPGKRHARCLVCRQEFATLPIVPPILNV